MFSLSITHALWSITPKAKRLTRYRELGPCLLTVDATESCVGAFLRCTIQASPSLDNSSLSLNVKKQTASSPLSLLFHPSKRTPKEESFDFISPCKWILKNSSKTKWRGHPSQCKNHAIHCPSLLELQPACLGVSPLSWFVFIFLPEIPQIANLKCPAKIQFFALSSSPPVFQLVKCSHWGWPERFALYKLPELLVFLGTVPLWRLNEFIHSFMAHDL